MKLLKISLLSVMLLSLLSCSENTSMNENKEDQQKEFKYLVDKFADLKIMRYQIPGFEDLSLQQKELIYYLSEAALCGRDIIFDQFYKHNLKIKQTLEAIVVSYDGDKTSKDYENFMVYVKRFWFSNGIHHHYSTDKFFPEIEESYFAELVKNSDESLISLKAGQSIDDFIKEITIIMFDPDIDIKRVNQDSKVDLIEGSANNFYEGVSQKEVEDFYKSKNDPNDETPVSHGLNSKLVKENGVVKEKVWKVGGMYSEAIEEIVFWLEKAVTVAENEEQKTSLESLIKYYKTGDLKVWDEYNIAWVNDLEALVDVVNGFIEIYGDPMGLKATFESVVNFKNLEATKRTVLISQNAMWFEKNSPVDDKFKKNEVKGVTAKVITVAQLGGDCFPSTPIGINLPNSSWIRGEYGSKSVTMENITYAYDQAAIGDGFLEEFAYSQEEIELSKKHGSLAGNIHTDLHECLGHGSGLLLPGVSTDALKNYYSPLEESRADLFALYYILDEKMVELGILPSLDAAKAEYNSYIRNGLMTQLTRVKLGKDIEQAHMRNRQIISKWCYENGKEEGIIKKEVKEGKTYFYITDYTKLRNLFGKLLAEVQRIKSEGDYEAAKNLVETYGVKVDIDLHKEVLARYETLNLAPYGGFMNPVFTAVKEGEKIVDVTVEYPDNYVEQMMNYAKKYSFLPVEN